MMKPEVRIPALGELGRVPVSIFSGFINSAFSGSALDKDYVDRYKNAYTAYLCEDAYVTVFNAVKDNAELTEKAKKLFTALKEAGYTSSEYDLAAILNAGELAFKSSDTDVLPDDVDDVKPTIQLDVDDKYQLAGHCTAVVNAYKLLFANVFSSKPPLGAYGLCPGHATYTKGAIYTYSHEKGRDAYRSPDIGGMLSIRALYKGLGFDALTESSKWSALELGAEDSKLYSVRYMGRFTAKVVDAAKGKAADAKDFWRQLSDWVEEKLTSVYEAYISQGMDEVWRAVQRASMNLVNAFVIEECDIRVSNLLLVKVCAPTLSINVGESAMDALEKRILATGQQNIAIRAITESDNQTGFKVYTIAMALNDVIEADAPSFAYQAWDDALSDGRSISEVLGTHNVIFGRHADGTQRCFNLADQNGKAHNMAVIAGAGSGKGLTTLATVGAAAARKEPLFYLDCKPEMSSILRKYMEERGQAGRVYSYDGQAIQLQLSNLIPGSNPQKYKPFELPFGINLSDAVKNGLAMCKAFALLLAIMKYVSVEAPEDQKARWATIGYSGVGGLAVFDELQLMNTLAWLPMLEAVKKLPAVNKQKGPEYTEYVKKLKSFVNASDENIRGAANALLRYSPISTLCLFQDFKFVTADKPVFQGLFRLQNLVGRIGDSSNERTRKSRNPRLYDALDKRKWVVAPTAADQVDLATLSNPIKPYLVFGTPEAVQGYQKTDAWNALPEDYRETLDTSKMDFIGLLTHPDYNIDLGISLAAGYDMAQHMLNMAGFGGTVEDYITSFQPEAMLDYTTLYKTAFKNFAAIKAGAIEYTNPPLAGTGPIPAPFAVGVVTEQGDYASRLDAETPVASDKVDAVHYDDLDEEDEVIAAIKNDESNLSDIKDMPESMDDTVLQNDIMAGTQEVLSEPEEPVETQTQQGFGQQGFGQQGQQGFGQQGFSQQVPPQPQPQPQAPKVNPALLKPFPQFMSIFQRQSPQIQQQTLQYQQIYGRPCVYAESAGAFMLQDDDGFLVPVSGPYAVPPNIQPGVYQGETWTSSSIFDTDAPQSIKVAPNGAVEVDERAAYTYGSPVQGPTASFKGRVKTITPQMSTKKLESAIAQRWAILLYAGAKAVGGAGLVARVSIGPNAFYVNGIPINITETILGDASLRVQDIVDFAELFKTYKGLKQLDIISTARIPFDAAYSNTALPFTQSKSLQLITFTGSDGKQIQYTRQQAAQNLQVPEDKLTSHFNTWTAFASKVNKGQTSTFCKPGTRLLMADYTKRLAIGAFGPNSNWSRKRRVFGALGMLACAAGTVVTGGIQVIRAARAEHRK